MMFFSFKKADGSRNATNLCSLPNLINIPHGRGPLGIWKALNASPTAETEVPLVTLLDKAALCNAVFFDFWFLERPLELFYEIIGHPPLCIRPRLDLASTKQCTHRENAKFI